MVDEKAVPKKGWRPLWPLGLALGLFSILLGIALAGQISSGQVLLPEEGAYQRLVVARNMASRFAWEILPGEFTSAFGTLLWPLLLAPVFFLLGASALWPWILNALLSIALIGLAYRAVRDAVGVPVVQAALLALMVVALPLAPLAASGMEHVLFLVLLLVFLEQWSRRMQSPKQAGILPLALTAVLLASTRYEGMVLVALAAFLLILRRDFAAGILVPCAAALPLAVYGMVSWRAGWLPVPASVYLRRAELIPANLAEWPAVVFRSLDALSVRSDLRAIVLLLTLLPAWLGFTKGEGSARDRAFYAPALALLVLLAHLTLVGNREFRYDAWLVMIGGWAALPALGRIIPADLRNLRKNTVALVAGGALAVLLGFPLLNRGIESAILFGESTEQAKWIYKLAGEWAAECAPGTVATDSPGTIAFLTGKESLVDLSGFAGRAAFQERRGGKISADWMRTEAERSGASMAILFQPLLQSQAAQIWTRIGGWNQADCTRCGSAELFQVQEDPDSLKCTERFLTNLPSINTVRKEDGGGSE